jgi:hypothetical protein
MKIFIPKNKQIKEHIEDAICNTISQEKECDYIGNKSDYKLYREMPQEEFDKLGIETTEHAIGNVLVYEDGQTFILDGFGYFRIKFV